MKFLFILVVYVVAWAFAQYSLLYQQTPLNFRHPIDSLTMAYYQMFGEMNLDTVIKSKPFYMESENECTENYDLYSNYTQIRCPDKDTNYAAYLLFGIYLMLTNVLLFNLLIAIFSSAYEQVQGCT